MNGAIEQYLPETRNLSCENLHQMLDRYGMVYVKPDKGRYGLGVMKVEMLRSRGRNMDRGVRGKHLRTDARNVGLLST